MSRPLAHGPRFTAKPLSASRPRRRQLFAGAKTAGLTAWCRRCGNGRRWRGISALDIPLPSASEGEQIAGATLLERPLLHMPSGTVSHLGPNFSIQSTLHTPSRTGPERTDSSGKMPVALGQKLGEIQLVGASGPGGFEVGARPVAGLRRHRGILAAGFAAVTVVLVVGEEPGQVPQLGLSTGGDRAPAVAIGTQHWPERQRGIAKLVNLLRGQRLIPPGRASASSRSWSVVLIDTHEPLIRSSVQIACKRP